MHIFMSSPVLALVAAGNLWYGLNSIANNGLNGLDSMFLPTALLGTILAIKTKY